MKVLDKVFRQLCTIFKWLFGIRVVKLDPLVPHLHDGLDSNVVVVLSTTKINSSAMAMNFNVFQFERNSADQKREF